MHREGLGEVYVSSTIPLTTFICAMYRMSADLICTYMDNRLISLMTSFLEHDVHSSAVMVSALCRSFHGI